MNEDNIINNAEKLSKLLNKDLSKEEIASSNYKEGHLAGYAEAHLEFHNMISAMEYLIAGFKHRLNED